MAHRRARRRGGQHPVRFCGLVRRLSVLWRDVSSYPPPHGTATAPPRPSVSDTVRHRAAAADGQGGGSRGRCSKAPTQPGTTMGTAMGTTRSSRRRKYVVLAGQLCRGGPEGPKGAFLPGAIRWSRPGERAWWSSEPPRRRQQDWGVSSQHTNYPHTREYTRGVPPRPASTNAYHRPHGRSRRSGRSPAAGQACRCPGRPAYPPRTSAAASCAVSLESLGQPHHCASQSPQGHFPRVVEQKAVPSLVLPSSGPVRGWVRFDGPAGATRQAGQARLGDVRTN